MSSARDLIYAFVNQQVERNELVEGGSDDDLYLHGLRDQVEDARAHREAERLRARARNLSASATGLVADAMSGATMAAATSIDPYVRRDGQLVRKADGKPVIL